MQLQENNQGGDSICASSRHPVLNYFPVTPPCSIPYFRSVFLAWFLFAFSPFMDDSIEYKFALRYWLWTSCFFVQWWCKYLFSYKYKNRHRSHRVVSFLFIYYKWIASSSVKKCIFGSPRSGFILWRAKLIQIKRKRNRRKWVSPSCPGGDKQTSSPCGNTTQYHCNTTAITHSLPFSSREMTAGDQLGGTSTGARAASVRADVHLIKLCLEEKGAAVNKRRRMLISKGAVYFTLYI